MATLDVTFQSIQTYSVQDFLSILDRLPPDDPGRYELIDGRIVMAPPASSEHGRTGSRIGSKLSTFILVHILGEPFDSSAGFILPSGDLVQPDFAFVSKDRFQNRPLPESTFERAVPNLVVEILSPSTARIDLNEKKAIYEANGVDEYWVVDYQQRQVTVFRLMKGRYDAGTVYEAGQEIASQVLSGLRCPVNELMP
jgi:Uma2 family endonuclease